MTSIVERFLERVNFEDINLYASTNGHVGLFSACEKNCKAWVLKKRPRLEDVWKVGKDLLPVDSRYPNLLSLFPKAPLPHKCDIDLQDQRLWGFLAASEKLHKNALITIFASGMICEIPDAWGKADSSLRLEYKIGITVDGGTVTLKSDYLSKIATQNKKSKVLTLEYDSPGSSLYALTHGGSSLYVIMPAKFN